MKFEEALPEMRKGKKAYIISGPFDHWIGKEKYFLQYFESMEDFKSKYPDTKLSMPSDPPKGSFLACFMNSILSHIEEDEEGRVTEVSDEKMYQEYLSSPHSVVESFENGKIQLASFSEEKDNIEYYYFDHANKKVMEFYYKNPTKMHHDYFFYSDVIVGSEWELFD